MSTQMMTDEERAQLAIEIINDLRWKNAFLFHEVRDACLRTQLTFHLPVPNEQVSSRWWKDHGMNGNRVPNLLARNSYTPAQIFQMTDAELLAIRGINRSSINIIRDFIRQFE